MRRMGDFPHGGNGAISPWGVFPPKTWPPWKDFSYCPVEYSPYSPYFPQWLFLGRRHGRRPLIILVHYGGVRLSSLWSLGLAPEEPLVLEPWQTPGPRSRPWQGTVFDQCNLPLSAAPSRGPRGGPGGPRRANKQKMPVLGPGRCPNGSGRPVAITTRHFNAKRA